MSTGLSYQFAPVPQKVKNLIYQAPLIGSEFKVLDGIANEVYLFPDTRETLTKELSLRFLAEKLKLHFTTVGKIIKRLARKGYIEIVKLGSRKEGSIIKFLADNLENVIRSIQPTKTVAPVLRKQENLVVNAPTNKETILKETNKKKSVSCLPFKNSVPEKTEDLTLKSVQQVSSLPPVQVQEVRSEFTAPAGIPEKVLSTGIKKLSTRGIQDINTALATIGAAIQKKSCLINNTAGYFLTLCEKMDLAAPPLAGSTPVPVKSSVPSAQKTQEYIQSLQQEKEKEENFIETLKTLVEKYPEEVTIVYQKVNKNSFNRFVPKDEVPALYVAEFRRCFPAYA